MSPHTPGPGNPCSDEPEALADPHLREHTLHSEPVYQGHFLQLFRDRVRLPDGGEATREYVRHPGAVVIVALVETAGEPLRLVVERQYRYPVRQVMIEFPAGKLDPGEPPGACARRELFEETGYRATAWARAGRMHPVIGYSDEFIEIWFARGLSQGARQLDAGEFLDVFTATPGELLAWSRAGHLTDAKTLTALLWLQNVLAGTWTLDWQPDAGLLGRG